jgi:protein TonB
MASKRMTFEKACFVSIGMHLLLFGAAIAVAGYAGGTFRQHHDVMMVSLADPGAEAGAGTAHIHRNPKDSEPARAAENRADTPLPESPPVNHELSDVPRVSPQQENGAGGEGAVADQERESAGAAGSGRGIGLVSAEQWSVIESAIEQSKNYPRIARERGIEGVVHIRFKLRQSGDVDTIEIVKSSGHDILDSASIRTVYRAAPMPYVAGWIEVPIAYVLNK